MRSEVRKQKTEIGNEFPVISRVPRQGGEILALAASAELAVATMAEPGHHLLAATPSQQHPDLPGSPVPNDALQKMRTGAQGTAVQRQANHLFNRVGVLTIELEIRLSARHIAIPQPGRRVRRQGGEQLPQFRDGPPVPGIAGVLVGEPDHQHARRGDGPANRAAKDLGDQFKNSAHASKITFP